MDRREFLLQSAALAVGTAAGELRGLSQSGQGMAPPVLKQTAPAAALQLIYPLDLGIRAKAAAGGVSVTFPEPDMARILAAEPS